MPLFIASDVHIAEVWSRVGALRLAGFVDAERNLSRLMRRVAKGDGLVLNGDVIDSRAAGYDGGGSNWDRLEALLARCTGRVFLNLGNHEYRRAPYNAGIYGLAHMGLRRGRRVASRVGYGRFRWLRELASIVCFSRRVDPRYPAPRFRSERWRGAELLFLDTGPEAYNRLRYALAPWLWRYVFADPAASWGVDDEQLAFLQERLRGSGDLLLFLHSPPFFSSERVEGVALAPGYFRRTGTYRHPIFIEHNLAFMEALRSSGRNIVVITGHTHVPRQFLLDKGTGMIRSSSLAEINRLRKDSRHVKFVSLLPLGVIKPKLNRTNGYLVLDAKGFRYVLLETGDGPRKEKKR